MKIIINSPKPMIHPQIFESFQGYVLPPHCNARSRQIIAQTKKNAPRRSISSIFCLSVKLLTFLFGFLKNTKTVAKDTPPKNGLIQKHHRQLTRSVNKPPRRGPTTEETANMLDRVAMYKPLLLSGTLYPTMVRPPEKRADAPAPETALPNIRTTLLWAAAHIMEPTSKMTRARRYVVLTEKCW